MSAQELITGHLDLWTGATATKSKSGRGSSSKTELVGIQKLRELILELATKGKLSIQNPQTESANELMAEVQSIKRGLEDAGKIKKQKRSPPIEHEKLTFSIPKNWAWVRLAELTEKIGSGATPRGGKSAYVTNGIPFFRSQNIWNDGLNLTDVAYIPVETHGKMANTHVYPDDILLNITGASLGRTTIVPCEIEEANVSQHVTIIRIIPPVSREFIHYLLLSPYVQAMVWGRQVGMAREGLSKKVLELFELPLPPLEEQHRIVQKVDELMALCDQLEQQTSDQIAAHGTLVDTLLGTLTQSQSATELSENWTRLAAHFDTLFTTEQSIDKLKQTILQLAVMGLLVKRNSEDEPAEKFVDRLKIEKARQINNKEIKAQAKMKSAHMNLPPHKMPNHWFAANLDEISHVQGGIQKQPKRRPIQNKHPYLRVADVQRGFLMDCSDLPEFELFNDEIKQYALKEDDILVVEGNGSAEEIGRCAIWDGRVSNCVYQNHLMRVRPIAPESCKYLSLYLNSPSGIEEMKRLAVTSSGLYNLSVGKIRSISVPLPPLLAQHRIVNKVDALMALCDQLKERLNQSSKTLCQLAETIVENALQ